MFLAACGGAGSQPDGTVSDQDYEDVATAVGAIVVSPDNSGDVASLNVSIDISIGLPPPGAILGGKGNYETSIGGLSYAWDVDCRDAGGMATYCGPLTDSAEVTSSQSGKIDTLRYDATVDHSTSWKLSKILSAKPVIDGQGTAKVTSSFTTLLGRRSTNFEFTYDARYEQIIIDPTSNMPVQGKIVYSVNATRNASTPRAEKGSTYSVDAEVLFDGTQTASVMIDGKASFKLDLATGDVTSP
jgi:hypothetical protein